MLLVAGDQVAFVSLAAQRPLARVKKELQVAAAAASSSTDIVQATPTIRLGAGDEVLVPRSTLKTILDNLDRAEQAARAAARVMSGGANAFEAEGNRIMSARMTIEALLHRSL